MQIYKKILIVLILFLPFFGFGTNYFLTNTGVGDSLSITEANAMAGSFTLGDTIFVFKRVYGQLNITDSGSSGNEIVIIGYDSNAVIYGSTELTIWTQHSGNIYRAYSTSTITQIFLDGEKMTLARYPNSGYDYIETVNTTSSFTSNELSASYDYVGCSWFGRTNDFACVTDIISAQSTKTLTLQSGAPAWGLTADDEGFILLNGYDLLDAAGEWYYDSVKDSVYLWTPNSNDPDNHTVLGSVEEYGINISGDYIKILNLKVRYAQDNGINLATGSDNITISGCNISFNEENGIRSGTVSNLTLTYDTISYSVWNGAYLPCSSSNISNNYIHHIFMLDDLGATGIGEWYNGCGLYAAGNNNTIQYNRIDSIGYNGILWTELATIQYNYITNFTMSKNDGGGIYTTGNASEPPDSTSSNDGSIVRYNIITDGWGTEEGFLTYGGAGFASGIYFDESSNGITTEYNTVKDIATSGFGINKGYNHGIRYNTIYGAGAGIELSYYCADVYFTKNTVYNTNHTHTNGIHESCIKINTFTAGYEPTIDSNLYINHYETAYNFRVGWNTYYNWTNWLAGYTYDDHSTIDVSSTSLQDSIFINPTNSSATFYLNGATSVEGVTGNSITTSFTIPAYESRIILGNGLDYISTTNSSQGSSSKKVYYNTRNGDYFY